MLAFDKTDVINTADVWMRHLPRDPHFISEPDERRLAHLSLSQELQRNRLVEDKVVRAIYLAHAAFTQQSKNAISSPKHRPGGKPTFLDTRG